MLNKKGLIMHKRKILSTGRIIALLFVMVFFSQTLNAMMHFISQEDLVKHAKYIVVAEMQNISNTGKTIKWGNMSVNVIKNKLKVVESIKGSWALDKPLFLNTFKFKGWMEDNVELPSKGSKVLLFLKHNEKGELRPVNGIQGVLLIDSNDKPRYGTLKEIREIVQKQADKIEESCSSKAFTSFLDTAETQT